MKNLDEKEAHWPSQSSCKDEWNKKRPSLESPSMPEKVFLCLRNMATTPEKGSFVSLPEFCLSIWSDVGPVWKSTVSPSLHSPETRSITTHQQANSTHLSSLPHYCQQPMCIVNLRLPHLALKPKGRKTNYAQKGREKEIAFPAKQVRVEWVSKQVSLFLNSMCKQQRPTDDTCKEKR